MKLTAIVNGIAQTLGTTVQIINWMIGSGYLSPKGQAALAGTVGAAQGVIAVLAHFKTPQGDKLTTK